jgi:hypothetical protein
MLTAEARIETEHPSRFLVQLCRRAQQAHRLRHSPPKHNGGDAQDLVARNIERFGKREHLSVDWRQPPSPGGGATPSGGTEPGGEGEARQESR